ncbi:MAG: hypothetical protein ACYC2R_10245 [Burkholderiales bacterium]
MKSERLLDAEKKRLPPSIMAFLLQAISLILVLALILPVLEHWTGPLPIPAVALMIGCGAAFLGIFAAMPSWWLPINLLFPLIVVLALPLGIPPLVYLIVFFLLMAMYRGVVLDRVPLYLSSKKARYVVLENLPEQAGSRFIDLGSGLGGLLMFLAERQPQGIFSGVESALLPYWFSRIRLFPLRQNCHVLWNNMWAIKLSEYDVIYAYLSPEPMAKLLGKLRSEMRQDAIFISNSFALPNIQPARKFELTDFSHSRLYIYRYDDLVSPRAAT